MKLSEKISEMESYLKDNQGDDESWQVLSDLLQEKGDPRGELIALKYSGKEDYHKQFLYELREKDNKKIILGPLYGKNRCTAFCKNTYVTRLSINFCSIMTPRHLREIINYHPMINEILLSGTPINFKTSKVFRELPKLKRLTLAGCMLTYNDCIKFRDIDTSDITSLQVSNSFLSYNKIKKIMDHDFQSLESLNLYGNELADHSISSIFNLGLKIKSLSLAGNHLSNYGIIDIVSMAKARTFIKGLKFLNLSHNHIGDQGAVIIGDSECFSNLELLELKGNGITNYGYDYLMGSPYLSNTVKSHLGNSIGKLIYSI